MMQKAVVVDFDGTLISCNSFELYYRYVFFYNLKHLKGRNFIRLIYWIVLRKFRVISHNKLKCFFLLNFSGMNCDESIDGFIKVLNTFLNEKVVDLLMYYKKKGDKVILSSAAPELYLIHFVDKYLDFIDCVISTKSPNKKNGEWCENIGLIKKENTFQQLSILNMSLDVFITDHYDDLPLLKANNGSNFIVAPSRKTQIILAENSIEYELL